MSRLDQLVAAKWPEYSRATAQKFIKDGRVSVNGEIVTSPSHQAEADYDELTLTQPSGVVAQNVPIIYQDDRVVVVNKPSGMLTHAKGAYHDEFTVADFARTVTTDGLDTNRPGIVHRLDRETSGILIIARDSEAKSHLQKQFQDRKAKKTYIALVKGEPKNPAAHIELPIERNPRNPATFRVGAGGKWALTSYEVLGAARGRSAVRLKPTTGRTHQLRVHMQYIDTPIVGDQLYDGGKSPIGRLCLHAEQLEVTLPGGARMTFVAPLPDDFKKLVDEAVSHG